jgi:hypothetical protein
MFWDKIGAWKSGCALACTPVKWVAALVVAEDIFKFGGSFFNANPNWAKKWTKLRREWMSSPYSHKRCRFISAAYG